MKCVVFFPVPHSLSLCVNKSLEQRIFKQHIYFPLQQEVPLEEKNPRCGRSITLCSCRSQVSFTIIFIVAGGTGIEDDGNVAPVKYLNSFLFSCTRTCNRIFSEDFVGASLRTKYLGNGAGLKFGTICWT